MEKLLREYPAPFHLDRCVDLSAPVSVEVGHGRGPHQRECRSDLFLDETEDRIPIGRFVAQQFHRRAQHGDLRASEHAAAGLQRVRYAAGVECSGECR